MAHPGQTVPRDKNYVAGLVATDSTDAAKTVAVTADVATGRLLVSSVGTISAPTAVVAFVTAVVTAGVRVQLASNTLTGVILEAPSTNTGLIYVGGTVVSNTVYGAELQPGQSTSIAIDNTSRIWIDASVSGDKVAALGS